MMQWKLFSIFLFIFSVFSLSNAVPDPVCMDGLDTIGDMAKKQLGPTFDRLVCSKGIKPGKKDWKWLEPKMQMVLDSIKKCPEHPDLPNHKPNLKSWRMQLWRDVSDLDTTSARKRIWKRLKAVRAVKR
jgi:hypothetical protein